MTGYPCGCCEKPAPLHLGIIFSSFMLSILLATLLCELVALISTDADITTPLTILINGAVFIPIPIIVCRFIEKRQPVTMGFSQKGISSEYLLGLLIGGVLMGVAFLMGIMTNAYSFEGFVGFSPKIILYILIFTVQSAGEEILCRGAFMLSLRYRVGTPLSVIISSAAFSIMHVGNESVDLLSILNIFLFGIFAGICVLKRGNIYMAMGIHGAWNFTQGNIFGFNVSGVNSLPSLFSTDMTGARKLLGGGEFGPESGLIITILLLISIVIFHNLPAKRSETVPNGVALFM